jgi:Domain of unknown function (DUF4157)
LAASSAQWLFVPTPLSRNAFAWGSADDQTTASGPDVGRSLIEILPTTASEHARVAEGGPHGGCPTSAPARPEPTSAPMDDPFEREADELSEEVMCIFGSPTIADENNRVGHRRASSGHNDEMPEIGTPDMSMTLRGGLALPGAVRSHFESRLDYDFSRVRVHADREAATATHMMHARAFTIGSHIAFGKGEYAPGTTAGLRLLAHELVHVIQQDGGAVHRHTPGMGSRWPSNSVLAAFSAPAISVAGPGLQRKPDGRPPGYEGRAGLVQWAVEELDGEARGQVLKQILDSVGRPQQIKLWALDLQFRRRANGTNYLYLFFKGLADDYEMIAIFYSYLLKQYGIVVAMTSGGFQSRDYLDPNVLAPAGPQAGGQSWEHYVDNFAAVRYDLDYKPDKRGWLSTTLQVSYADGTKIDISIWDISDNLDPAWENAIAQAYKGPGERYFPSRLSRNTIPKLWKEKHKALATMNASNEDFVTFVSIGMAGIMSNLPLMPLFPVEAPVPEPVPTGVKSRSVPKPLGGAPTRTQTKPPGSPKVPEPARAPRIERPAPKIPGQPRPPTHPGKMWHYTNADPASISSTGISRGHSFTVEGDLGGRNAMARLGLKRQPTYVVEVADTGQFRLAGPDKVQPHAYGQGGAYDYVNTAPIPPRTSPSGNVDEMVRLGVH